MPSFVEQAMQRNNLRTAMIEDWKTASRLAKEAIADERQKRLDLITLFSAHADPNDLHASMENVDLPNGEMLKIQHKVDYKLGNADEVVKQLNLIEQSQEGGNVIAERLVVWKPEISVTNYKLLNPIQKALIDKVLTVKAASKSIEIKKA